ncbi:S-layer homology domain-containing protein [Anaerotignum faecicola]|nr:S-layer homology domain-containing protein [Anaerotignum faecicola]
MMKKKSGKRFLSWLLAVVMIIALMPATAFAEPPTESSGNTEPAVTAYCPSSEGGTDVSVGEYDSSPAAETKDTPAEEPAKDTPAEEPVKDTPAEEPVKESPVADKTTEDTPAQEGAVENSTDEKIIEDSTNEASAADLAGLTAMFGAPVSLELYANKSYPIYVYGYFVNGKDKNDEDNILSGKDGLFGKDIKIQKDNKKVQTVKWNDYSIIGKPKSDYITFGKIENGTTVKPAKDAEKESISADVLEAMLTASLGDSTDMQNQYFSWKDVAIDDWDLHIARDATNYSDEDGKYTWHMDGKIHTYKIKYMADSTDVSKEAHVDKNTYYCGTYTIDTYKPNAPKGKVFAGWTVNDDTNSGKYYQGGDTITLKDHDTDNTGKITLKAQWEDQKYPVYVYGLFKYKNTTFDKNSSLYINGSTDSINLNNDSFITFGALNDATTFDPAPYKDQGVISKETIPTAEIEARIEKGDVELSDSTGSAKTNGLLTESTKISPLVSKWYGLKSCPGATDYVEGDDATWHLDGEINLYKVTYAKGNIPDGEDFTLPKEETYFLGDYTVRKMETSSQNYKFLGWVYENELLKEGSTIKAPNKDITLTAKWEKKPVVYKVNYDWGTFAPSDQTCPTNGNSYETEAAVPMDTTFNSNSTSNANNGEQKGLWTFSGWTKDATIQTNYGDDVITKTITYKGTWTFEAKPITTTYKVVYKWDGGDGVPEGVTLPTDSTSYDSETAAKNAVDKNFTSASTSNAKKGDKEGLWKFSGWTPSDPVDSTTEEHTKVITFTGTWTFAEKVVKVTYDWGTPAPSDKTCPTGGTYNTEEAAKADMDKIFTNTSTSNAPNGSIAGSWKFSGWTETKTTSDDGNTILIALTGTWKFTPSETKTITSVLNTLVWKDFKSQHGYSTEGTFTAIAKVMPVHPEINSYAAEVDESSDNNTNTPGTDNAKTFTGTVTLKTGETKAFDFSAKDKMADVLTPNTRYTVRVSEDKGDLSKVTYDTTKYILGFETDGNAVVDYIWIAKEKDSENDHPELEPVEGTTITFHNIYTYKRHHSSSDGGNGGGKKEEKPTVEIKDDDALGLNNTDHFAYIVGYGNGEVRPQNSITRAEVAAIFFRLLEDDVRDANYTRQNKFTDVSNDAWYCSAVSTLSAMGIISGYPDATFRPNASITRAEFAAIATRFDVNGDKTPASFNDIAGHWAKDEIAVAANNGWVNGYEDGSFRPQNKITRAETMSLVNRVLNRKPETAEDLLENMTKWTDNADTNAWYYLAVQEATNSHYYEYKENSQYEKWTELRETRDWSELDK